MHCPKCGKNIPYGSKFCPGCGNRAFFAIRWLNLALGLFLFMVAALWMYYQAGASKVPDAAVWRLVFGYTAFILFLAVLAILIARSISVLRRHPISGSFGLLLLLACLGFAVWVIYIQISPPASIKAVIVKGPISDASVSLYELKDNGEKGKLIEGPKKTYVSGEVYFLGLRDLPKRLFIEAKGGSYLDEATGQRIFLKDTDVLTAVLPAGMRAVAVTPFTHMAAALAQTKIQGGEAPDTAVIAANAAVAKQYGLTSVLDIPAENEKYNQLLAGFSQLAKNLNIPPGELINALAKDWSDGKVDGRQNNQAVTLTGGKNLGPAGTTGLANATDQSTKNKGTPSSKEATVIVNPPPTKTTSGFTITTQSLPAWVSGQQGRYAVTAAGGSLPYRWSVISGGMPQGFTFSQDGIISGSFSLPSGVSKKIFPEFTLEAKDQKGETKTVTLTITIVTEAPTIITYNPPTLTVDQSYDEKIATASGGLPPYRFYREAVSGPMPMGMEITTSGSDAILSGSPQAKGSFYFRVCVVDKADTEKCGDVAFTVKDAEVAAPPPVPPPAPVECDVQFTITFSHCTQIGTYEDGSPHNVIDSAGTAGGPVGAQLFAYMAAGDLATCGGWTTVNDSQEKCRRDAGQPAQISWTLRGAELPPGDTSEIKVYAPYNPACGGGDTKGGTIGRSCSR